MVNFRTENLIPPQNIEIEEGILGGILLDPEAIGRVLELLTPEAFYIPAHAEIYRAALALNSQGKPIDLMTITDYLTDQKQLEKIGGQAKLIQLLERTVSAVNIDSLAVVIAEKYTRRQLIAAGNKITAQGYDTVSKIEESLDRSEQAIYNISANRSGTKLTTLSSALVIAAKDIDERRTTLAPPGLTCDFLDLDGMTGGFSRSDLIILAGRPSMGKCVAFHSQIVLADGSLKTIQEIYNDRKAKLLTLGENLKIQYTEPSAYIDDGVKPTFRVTTCLGRQIETTITHPFLTIGGWKPLSEIQAGTKVAVPRTLGTFGHETVRDCEIKILGYLLADGSLSGGQPGFTNSNLEIQADFIEAVESFNDLSTRKYDSQGKKAPTFYVTYNRQTLLQERKKFATRLSEEIKKSGFSNPRIEKILELDPGIVSRWRKASGLPNPIIIEKLVHVLGIAIQDLLPSGLESIAWENPLTAWLRKIGLWGKTAHSKSIPDFVFSLERRQIALLLNRLLATDGWICILAAGPCQVGYCTVNETFARQIQHLFLRFGIIAKLRFRSVKYKGGLKYAWSLDITDAKSIQCVIDEIGIYAKDEMIKNVRTALEQKNYQTNRDLIPVETWELLKLAKGSESWKSLATRAGIKGASNIHVGKRAFTRKRLSVLVSVLSASAQTTVLQNLASSDVYWDEIKSIEYVGEQQVYDLTIPETHNFIANDICVHNTSAGMQIAHNIARKHQLPVLIFSMEMSKEQIVQRFIACEAGVDSNRLRAGRISDIEWSSVLGSIDRMNQLPIYIDDTSDISVAGMRAQARRACAETGKPLGLILLDYIQLMGNGNSDNRVEELDKIARGLKGLAKEFTVPLIALSQLSRGVESRNDKRPMMSDLRSSGAIEQTADIVIMLYRESYYNPNSINKETELIINKNRNGAVGTVKMMFEPGLTKFKNITRF